MSLTKTKQTNSTTPLLRRTLQIICQHWGFFLCYHFQDNLTYISTLVVYNCLHACFLSLKCYFTSTQRWSQFLTNKFWQVHMLGITSPFQKQPSSTAGSSYIECKTLKQHLYSSITKLFYQPKDNSASVDAAAEPSRMLPLSLTLFQPTNCE